MYLLCVADQKSRAFMLCSLFDANSKSGMERYKVEEQCCHMENRLPRYLWHVCSLQLKCLTIVMLKSEVSTLKGVANRVL